MDEVPILDGSLKDAVWERAEIADDFEQVEPVPGGRPSFRTEMRVLTDGDTLFIGLRAYDDDPDGIVVNRMGRDEFFFWDDHFLLSIDPFRDRRNGYFFLVNAVGGRRDGSIERDSTESNWDGIWYAAAQIDEGGWSAEIAIPFKTLPFRPGSDEWGLNVERRVRRSNESMRWADASLERLSTNMSRAGALEGMRAARRGIGLDVIPSMSVVGLHDERANRDKLRLEPSFDAFYRLLPGLTASVTANTDFRQTEVDDAQLNLTRFELFFPEKRSFFLQDSGIFDFGGLDTENGIPFFSRRIGLDRNLDDVRLLGGGKITGRVGRFNVGLVSIQQDRNLGLDDRNLSVARVSANVLEGSTLGLLLTHGDPRSRNGNLVAGADFNLRSNEIVQGRYVTGSLFLLQNFDEEEGRAYGQRSTGWGGELAYPNDHVNWRVAFRDYQNGFDPKLGFVNRSDIRLYEGSYRYRIRRSRGIVRTVDFEARPSLTTDRDDETQLTNWGFIPIRITTGFGDVIETFVYQAFERVPVSFPLADHVFVPSGVYSTAGGYVQVESSQARPFQVLLRLGYATLYTGEIARARLAVEWRPSPHWLLAAELDERQLWSFESCRGAVACDGSPGTTRTSAFALRLARVRVGINFTPDLSWSTLVQYENRTDALAAQSRIRWIVEPGREIFFVVGQDFDASPSDFRVTSTEIIAKASWTFRF